MERLSTLKEKTKDKVVEIIGGTHFQSRMISIGITAGSDVEITQNYKKQPTLIYCRDMMIAANEIEAEKIAMEVLWDIKKITIALLGQPNSGKSTLFNGLTGSNQHTGDWLGKTAEKREGEFLYKNTSYTAVDLPGTYGLSADSEEEVITREYVEAGNADLIATMADASQLNRSLFMFSDYIEINIPVVLIVSIMDVAVSQGKDINIKGLQKSLNVPVIPIVVVDKKEYREFYASLKYSDSGRILVDNSSERTCESIVGDEYKLLKNYIPDEGIGVFSKLWVVGRLFDQDAKVTELTKDNVDEYKFKEMEDILRDIKDGDLVTGNCKLDRVDKLINANVI